MKRKYTAASAKPVTRQKTTAAKPTAPKPTAPKATAPSARAVARGIRTAKGKAKGTQWAEPTCPALPRPPIPALGEPAGSAADDAPWVEETHEGVGTVPWVPGDMTYKDQTWSLTINHKGCDVPRTFYDHVIKLVESIRTKRAGDDPPYMVCQERGIKEHYLHIHAAFHCRFPLKERFKKTDRASRNRWAKFIRDCLGIGTEYNVVVKVFGPTQTMEQMAGYYHKAEQQSGHRLHAHGYTLAQLRSFKELYVHKTLFSSNHDSRQHIKQNNVLKYVHHFHTHNLAPAKQSLLATLTLMMRTGDYLPDSSWVEPTRGRGMNLERAETAWAMHVTDRPSEIDAAAVANVFFEPPAFRQRHLDLGNPNEHVVAGISDIFRSNNEVLSMPLSSLRAIAATEGNVIINSRLSADRAATKAKDVAPSLLHSKFMEDFYNQSFVRQASADIGSKHNESCGSTTESRADATEIDSALPSSMDGTRHGVATDFENASETASHDEAMRQDLANNPDTCGYERDGFIVADGEDDDGANESEA
jgi:hypothetical protein